MQWREHREGLKEFGIITLGVIIMDIGIYVFKFPNYFSFGGASGLAVVLNQVLPISPSSINLIINMVLLIAGFAILGKSFGLKTTYVTILSSILLNIMEHYFPMTGPLTNQTGLELIYAIALPAVAAAMLFHVNASGGGTDILAMILKKHTTLDISMALFLIDSIVVAAAFFVFDIKTGLYSICGLVTKTIFIDKTIERMKLCKCLTIVCSHPDPICQYINMDLHRSATIYEAKGAYTNEGKTVILSTLDYRQTVLLERFIKRVEPSAFVIVTKSSEILGRGFSKMIG